MPEQIARNARIFVAGHRGLVGSAIVRRLEREGFAHLLLAGREELDLRDPAGVGVWFEQNRPEYVFQRARSAAASGDLDRANAELETLYARGIDDFGVLQSDPAYSALRDDPRFRELVYAWASRHIERWRECGRLSASELRVLAAAHRVRGETAEARALFEDEVPACARGRTE